MNACAILVPNCGNGVIGTDYDCRSTHAGSRRAARRAGMKTAAAAETSRIPVALVKARPCVEANVHPRALGKNLVEVGGHLRPARSEMTEAEEPARKSWRARRLPMQCRRHARLGSIIAFQMRSRTRCRSRA